MKESRFIEEFKKKYSNGIDRYKQIDVFPEPEEPYPFVVNREHENLGCVYLHIENENIVRAVWILYLKSYNEGNGSKILKLLCQEADAYNVNLYLEPLPDEDGRLNFQDLVSLYRRHGFVGDVTMLRTANV